MFEKKDTSSNNKQELQELEKMSDLTSAPNGIHIVFKCLR